MARFRDFSKENGDIASSGSGSGLFLKLEKGNRYKVRLVGKPLQYYQHWEPVVCRSPYTDDKGSVVDPLMQAGYQPKVRFCIWVIDREDGGLKIMDFPPTLYNSFREWQKGTNEDPGGYNGPDWNITVTAPSGKQQYVKYSATSLVQTSFTEEELKQIKDGNLKERMMKVRADNTPDEIRELMAEKGVGTSSDVKKENAESRVTTKPATAAKQEPEPKETVAPKPEEKKAQSISPDLEF
jgi:hypothetical protein